MQFTTRNLTVCTDAIVTAFDSSDYDSYVTKCLHGAYLAWIESARHGPVAEHCDTLLRQSKEFDVSSSGFIVNLSDRVRISLLTDPHNPQLITPKERKDNTLQWWFPPSDEPDPTKKQAKKEKNAEILDDGIASKDPSRLFWIRFDFPNQFVETDLHEHEMNSWRIYSSPFKNGSWFMQAMELIYGLDRFTYQAFHTLEGNALYNDMFFARITPAFIYPFSYYETILCYLPEEFDRDKFVWSLAALSDYELTAGTEERRLSSTLRTAMRIERENLLNGPQIARNTLRQKQTELANLSPSTAEYNELEQECQSLLRRIKIEKVEQCYYLPSLLAIK